MEVARSAAGVDAEEWADHLRPGRAASVSVRHAGTVSRMFRGNPAISRPAPSAERK